MIDIEPGYVLTMNGKDYPVIKVADWSERKFANSSFLMMATETVTLKKESFDAEGKSTVVSFGSSLQALPLDPVSADLKRSLGLETVHEVKQTFVADATGFLNVYVEDQTP